MFAASAHERGDEVLCGLASAAAERLGVDMAALRQLHTP
jgi:hypothetical protein